MKVHMSSSIRLEIQQIEQYGLVQIQMVKTD